MDKPVMMAACGLDCGACEIRLAATDSVAGKVVIDWFRKEGWLGENEGLKQAIERNMLCSGCLGDRNTHWDSGCWILVCCVDDKGHNNCSECEQFPCSKLVGWAEQNDGYRKAFERLKVLRREKSI